MINVKDLTVRVGEHTLVDQVSFTAQAGEVTGLIGPNGAGKSTVLAAVAGDIDYSGEITVGGLSPKAPARELARTRAVMRQDASVSWSAMSLQWGVVLGKELPTRTLTMLLLTPPSIPPASHTSRAETSARCPAASAPALPSHGCLPKIPRLSCSMSQRPRWISGTKNNCWAQ